MGFTRNQANTIRLFAFNTTTALPVAGDAANITVRLSLDSGASFATAAVHPTDAGSGYYTLPVTAAETDGDTIDVIPTSTTGSVEVLGVPSRIFTTAAAATGAVSDTLDTSGTAYLSPTEYLKRADKRTVAKLCSDTNDAVTDVALPTNPNLLAALADASGEAESAFVSMGRYTVVQLQSLSGMAQARFYRLLTRLTTCFLWERRPGAAEKPWYYDQTLKEIDDIAAGKKIFGFKTIQDAQLLDRTEDDRNVIDYVRATTASKATRFFGRRRNRMDPW